LAGACGTDQATQAASPVLRTCGDVGLIGLGLIEPWLSCCAGVAWGLGASAVPRQQPGQRSRRQRARYGPPSVEKLLGALPVVADFCQRLDLQAIVDRACPVRQVATLTTGR
jgi:hypothetical protein